MRNNMLYELSVFKGKTMLFRFRDSMHLLPGSLNSLAKSLCPELGVKGSIEYDKVNIEYIGNPQNKNHLIEYMKQDIHLLGGVMKKAQDLIWTLYQVDIESKITQASLAVI